MTRVAVFSTLFHSTLFQVHARGANPYLARRVGQVADDLLAETFLEVLGSRGQFDPGREPERGCTASRPNLLHRRYRQDRTPGEVSIGQVDAQQRVGRLVVKLPDALLKVATWACIASAALSIHPRSSQCELH